MDLNGYFSSSIAATMEFEFSSTSREESRPKLHTPSESIAKECHRLVAAETRVGHKTCARR